MSELIDRSVLKARMYSEAFESDTDMQRWDSGCWIRYKLFEKVVDNMPTVPYSPRWHRVEEELPPDGTIGRYLAYVFTNDAHWELHIVAWFRNKWLFNCGRVHYWMPIEPPKEDA